MENIKPHSLIYYRLIALWVLNEAMLGGIIHGLKIPVSGLIVGSCAVICICLIAWYVPVRGAIIQATVIVAIFKMMLSPQAPPPAYIAVFFQGLLGELLFFNRRFFKISCFVLAAVSLLESGLQRIITLTIIYGNDLWKVINNSINKLTGQELAFNYSLLIAGGYVLVHLIVGFGVGWLAAILPEKIKAWSNDDNIKMVVKNEASSPLPSVQIKRRRRLKMGLFIAWLLLIVLYVQSYFKLGKPLLPPHISLKILLRSFIVVLSWYFLVGPIIKKLLHSWLQKKQARAQLEIKQVLELLPLTRQLISQSWKRSVGLRGLKRLTLCMKIILVNALNPIVAGRLYILAGPIETGKTTSLIKWSEQKEDVFGILTPIVNGKRTFMEVHARHLFDMEANEQEKERLLVGRYAFSKKNFDKAIQVIRDAQSRKGWIVIDEIGPMELRGEGFREVIKEVLASANPEQKIVLVVRQGLVEAVKQSFQLKDAIVINKVSDLV